MIEFDGPTTYFDTPEEGFFLYWGRFPGDERPNSKIWQVVHAWINARAEQYLRIGTSVYVPRYLVENKLADDFNIDGAA